MMGRLKTQAWKENEALRKAHKMAEAFCKNKTKTFLTRFLTESGMGEAEYIYYTQLQKLYAQRLEVLENKIAYAPNDILKQQFQKEFDDLKEQIHEKLLTKTEYFDEMLKDYDQHFGQQLALTYAIGYMDCSKGSTIKQLYVPAKIATPEKSLLILPGTE